MYTSAEDYEKALDALVDRRAISYDDARRQLGPDPAASELPSQRLSEDEIGAIGAFFCGDCLADIAPGSSCGHVNVAQDGTRKILR